MSNFDERKKHIEILRKLGWNSTMLSLMRDEDVRKAAENKEKPPCKS